MLTGLLLVALSLSFTSCEDGAKKETKAGEWKEPMQQIGVTSKGSNKYYTKTDRGEFIKDIENRTDGKY